MHSDTPTDIEARAAQWLAQRDGTQWAAADAQALEAWLTDTRHRVAFLRLQASWQQAERLQALGAGWTQQGPPPRQHWQAPPSSRREQMLQAVAQSPMRRNVTTRNRWSQVASMAVLAGGCALLVSWGWRNYTHVAVAVGGYRAVAVGTRFSVRRDRNDLRVVVTEGTVRLDAPSTDGQSSPSSLLPAGSVALVHDGSVLVRSLALAEAAQLLGWQDGWLVFRDTPLQDAVAEFNRYNRRKLRIADAEAGALRIGGSFRWDNEDTFVRLLEAGFPVRAEATPTQIVLSSR